MKKIASLLLALLLTAALLPTALLSHAELLEPEVSLTADLTECEIGDVVHLSVSVTTEYEITGYRWTGGPAGATIEFDGSESYTFTPNAAGTYSFSCAVTVSFGEETAVGKSKAVTVVVTEPEDPGDTSELEHPKISVPESASWVLGSEPALHLNCTLLSETDAEVEYQWYESKTGSADDIEPIENETNPVLVPGLSAAGTYWFFCSVTLRKTTISPPL